MPWTHAIARASQPALDLKPAPHGERRQHQRSEGKDGRPSPRPLKATPTSGTLTLIETTNRTLTPATASPGCSARDCQGDTWITPIGGAVRLLRDELDHRLRQSRRDRAVAGALVRFGDRRTTKAVASVGRSIQLDHPSSAPVAVAARSHTGDTAARSRRRQTVALCGRARPRYTQRAAPPSTPEDRAGAGATVP
jgi:hypothetical protein